MYKVLRYAYNVYAVVTIKGNVGTYNAEPDEFVEKVLFKGSLCECESFIRLEQKGYIIDNHKPFKDKRNGLFDKWILDNGEL